MEDPVTASDGRVYERAGIEMWLELGNSEFPGNGVSIESHELYANDDMREEILAWKTRKVSSIGDGGGSVVEEAAVAVAVAVAAPEGREDEQADQPSQESCAEGDVLPATPDITGVVSKEATAASEQGDAVEEVDVVEGESLVVAAESAGSEEIITLVDEGPAAARSNSMTEVVLELATYDEVAALLVVGESSSGGAEVVEGSMSHDASQARASSANGGEGQVGTVVSDAVHEEAAAAVEHHAGCVVDEQLYEGYVSAGEEDPVSNDTASREVLAVEEAGDYDSKGSAEHEPPASVDVSAVAADSASYAESVLGVESSLATESTHDAERVCEAESATDGVVDVACVLVAENVSASTTSENGACNHKDLDVDVESEVSDDIL